MNIILVSGDLAKTRTLTIDGWHALLLVSVVVLGIIAAGILFNYLILPTASRLMSGAAFIGQQQDEQRNQRYLQERLNQLALKVGDLQAQLLQMNGLGDKLAKIAGLKPQDLPASSIPGRGGASSTTIPSRQFTFNEFSNELDMLSHQVEGRHQQFHVLQGLLVRDSVKKKFIPTMSPIDTVEYSSNFGWRIDPFNGERAFHEGVDFMAEVGTRVSAAASGKVVYAGAHPQYGKMVEIDHGNGLVTRYAHASKLLVNEGDLVMRGQNIAEVGSTGRSTGPHLHFEVRLNGVPQNPARFLQASR